MTIQMTCACGANLSFEDAQLGTTGPCYQCGQTLTVAPTLAASPIAVAAAAMHAPVVHDVGSSQKEGWSWHYSKAIGVMYGPIPVGIIAVVVFGIIYMVAR